MRIAILGNSGSGKSTLAAWLSARSGAAQLDLDSVAWVPGEIAVARPAEHALADVQSFCSRYGDWVVEGCYTSLIEPALLHMPLLLFLNPGVDRCIANCQARPWEPQKYRSRQEQDERLGYLLAWVRDYYSRDGELSLVAHRACFDSYTERKQEVTEVPCLDRWMEGALLSRCSMPQSEALGGCYCREVRYAISGTPEQSLVCHCPDCRRSAGAQSVGWLLVRSEQFTLTSGTPKTFNSSAGVIRAFCGRCGTTLTWVGDKQPGRIDVTIGSLDDPNQFPPSRAVYRKHKVGWASEI